MLYFIIMIIVVTIVTLLIAHWLDEEIAAGACVVLAGFLLILPIANHACEDTKSEFQEIAYEITGLEFKTETYEDASLTGAFLLGSGFVTGSSETTKEMYYVFFANTEYGKQLQTIQGENIYIKETDEESPKLIKIMDKRQRKANWIDVLWGHEYGEIIELNAKEKGQILVVPTNTVKIDYNVEI